MQTTKHFKKILIANRGEIACRVIKTARKLGIETVAVYSDADDGALHMRMADEAVHIGPSQSAESYLRIDKIIAACKQTGAEAVHPGYGFLSENNKFREALDAEGIVFIGPGPKAIELMGDKITSKLFAKDAGVSTVPGHTETIKDADEAVSIANSIGYPVMLKASAGGGGKGMRVVWNDDDCRTGFEQATNEAASSFGDTRVFAEKFIEEPRHIEIQVIADRYGKALYLGERECSIQRRHQKVIEEAPSPFLDDKTRKEMGEQAVALAKAVGYESAGTVEFIVDANRNFYFLEMNTRLQVEHPVTEYITGLDLVELMIRVAEGQALPMDQSDITLTGWAMEARVYAEDPQRNFLPSIGRLVDYQPPAETATIRVDSGIVEGSEVSMFYDPMIAKLVTYGDTREAAIDEMADALDGYYIRGVAHNISFLNALLLHPRFREGRLTTNFIAEEYPDGFSAKDVPVADKLIPVAIATLVHFKRQERLAEIAPANQVVGLNKPKVEPANEWVVIADGQQYPVYIAHDEDGYAITHQDKVYRVRSETLAGEPLVRATINGKPEIVQVDASGAGFSLFYRGNQTNALVVTPRAAELNGFMLEKVAPDLSKFLLSPMPGVLVRLNVKEGDEVKAGEELAVVEAMKMENSLRAAVDGVVEKVAAEVGESLQVDQAIIEFE
ncbi:MAG: acetyl/propionyl/methylcrotonyl-CoA carboxylase subunit alpha [Pseudomonadota bacterium]